jgi:hypothetical protein
MTGEVVRLRARRCCRQVESLGFASDRRLAIIDAELREVERADRHTPGEKSRRVEGI